MTRVLEFRTLAELDHVQLAWQLLLQATPGGSFFQSLDWLRLYWHHFGARQHLRVLVLESQGEVQGILPLVVRREMTRLGPIRVLTYPLHDWGSFFSPVGPNPTATLIAGLRHLQQQTRDWDLLDLRWVNATEWDRDRTPTALAAAGFPCSRRAWKRVAVVEFQNTWEDYFAGLDPKFRSNLRRAERLAARAGELAFERYRPGGAQQDEGAPQWNVFDDCLELANRSWQASSRDGTTLSHPSVREFFRELFGIAARAGTLDVNLLKLSGRLIAFSFNLCMHGRLTGLRIGFDPDAAALSPGRLLLARSIQDSFQRQDVCLDLGSESMPFKQQWLTRAVESMRYTHYSSQSPRSQLLRVKHWLTGLRCPLKGPAIP
jgi:CelD/BcsL family acetyltransferase involved in cellulose biosynthesis